ncbi:hypothetical protein BC936DRAFT_146285 [Jimgerdemannia flammicorona]|uniref:Uncharacterized protein n=2 Tax=Jimgerdemannia flammicorona TaxID=994334 RepID=A0A433QY51_9FUNG|nr:hypothetical protein BC936DRAFT_146285 [Jimgerdemannia flammicorona]RUS34708.1 hypothetical protein BC938DRAFT_478993 [Jimgerdemannia flammicorona]
MWRILQFEIDLDKSVGCFRPSDVISGRVLLVLAETLYVRAIRVRIYGEERTGTTKLTFFDVESAVVGSLGGGINIHASFRSSTHSHIRPSFSLSHLPHLFPPFPPLPKGSRLPSKISLDTGSLSYPFKIKLPAINYPPSLEVPNTSPSFLLMPYPFTPPTPRYVHFSQRVAESVDDPPSNFIRYVVTAYIDIVGRPEWKKAEDVFVKFQPIVIAPMREACVLITRVPDAERDRERGVEKGGGGVVKDCLAQVTVRMPREVWCAGDTMSLELTLKNLGSTTIHHLTVDLHSRIDTPAPSPPPRLVTTSLAKKPHDLYPRLSPGDSATYSLLFHLPTTLPFPTFRTHARILSYQLCGTAAFARRNFRGDPPLAWAVPIEIANVESGEAIYWPVCLPWRGQEKVKPVFLDGEQPIEVARVAEPPPYRREREGSVIPEGVWSGAEEEAASVAVAMARAGAGAGAGGYVETLVS